MLAYPAISEKALNLCRWMTIIAAIAAPISTAVASIASVALLVFWLLSGQALLTLKLSWQQPVGKMILLFVAWLLIGTLYADTDWSSKLETLSSWKKLFYVFLLIGVFQPLQWQKRFVYSYFIAMVVAGIVAILFWALDLVVRQDREIGIFMTNHATQSTAFVAALLCAIFLVREPLTTQQKYAVWAGIAIFLFNIFFVSTGRSGYLAVPIAAIFALGSIYGYSKLPQIIGIAAIVLLAFGLNSSTLQERFRLAWDEQASYQSSKDLTSVGIRVVFYQNTLELIEKAPWFGYGTSSFKPTYSNYASAKSQGWQGTSTSDPHNQYLFIWLENGLIGLLLFFAYIVVALRQGMNNKPYGPIAASFLVAICASSLFNSHFKTFAEGYLLAFFLGALLSRPSDSTLRQADA
jgi:O-antigen ligase